MAYTSAWRNFKRMQDLTVAVASLIYLAASLHAVERLPGGPAMLTDWIVVWPGMFLMLALVVPLSVPPLRRWLAKYVWMSFQAGFGQTAGSVVVGVALLMGAALFIYWQIAAAAQDGRYSPNVFSAYAAGIGILAAQAVLVRVLERLPDVRAKITEPGG